jgi:hypothetical protein
MRVSAFEAFVMVVFLLGGSCYLFYIGITGADVFPEPYNSGCPRQAPSAAQ